MAEFFLEDTKTIINKRNYCEYWFWDRYSINPYKGCMFGCTYCDSRSQKYYLPEDFENKIIVKQPVDILLQKRLKGARTFKQDVVVIGGVTDPYQPIEKRYQNTRKILQVLKTFRYPVHIITKSQQVLRDAELLNDIAQQTWCTVSVSINTLDSNHSKFLDHRSPPPRNRLRVIEQMKTQYPDIQVGVTMMPIAPGLGDDEASMLALMHQAKDHGADYVMFSVGMTLRDQQAVWFLRKLHEYAPQLMPLYEQLYQFRYHPDHYNGRYGPSHAYIKDKQQFLLSQSKALDIPFTIARFLPKDYRHWNFRLAERLFRAARYLQLQGQPAKKWTLLASKVNDFNRDIRQVFTDESIYQWPEVDDQLRLKLKQFAQEELLREA